MTRLVPLLPNPADSDAGIVGPFLRLEGDVGTLVGTEVSLAALPGPDDTRLRRVRADVDDLGPLLLLPQLERALGAAPVGFLVGGGNLLVCAVDDLDSALFGHSVAWQRWREAGGVSPCGYVARDGRLEPYAPEPGHPVELAARRARANFEAAQWNAQRDDVAADAARAGLYPVAAYPGESGAECVVSEQNLTEDRLLVPEVDVVVLKSVTGGYEPMSFAAFRERCGDALVRVDTLVPARWLLTRWP